MYQFLYTFSYFNITDALGYFNFNYYLFLHSLHKTSFFSILRDVIE